MSPTNGAPIGDRLPGRISLIVPAHNEADNLPGLLAKSRQVLAVLADDFEIILVDDGSTDDTQSVARASMGDQADRLRIVSHERKSGYGISVADGLRAARGEVVGFVDGDGQFDVADLVTLAAMLRSSDLAAGWRMARADPWHRSVVSGTFNVLVRLLYGLNYRDVDCGMKLFKRRVLDGASPLLARSALLNTELYFKTRRNGFEIAQVGIPHYPRLAGVRSGARLRPILRAVRELFSLRWQLARNWRPAAAAMPSGQPREV